MTTDTDTTDPRPLAVQAAELMGWIEIRDTEDGPYGNPPNEVRTWKRAPRPDVDPGDALRLLEYVVSLPGFLESNLSKQDNGQFRLVITFLHLARLSVGKGDTLPMAITLACVAALRALAEEQSP